MRCDGAVVRVGGGGKQHRELVWGGGFCGVGEPLMNHSIIHPSPARFSSMGTAPHPSVYTSNTALVSLLRTYADWRGCDRRRFFFFCNRVACVKKHDRFDIKTGNTNDCGATQTTVLFISPTDGRGFFARSRSHLDGGEERRWGVVGSLSGAWLSRTAWRSEKDAMYSVVRFRQHVWVHHISQSSMKREPCWRNNQ